MQTVRRTALPPGPRLPSLAQAVRYTFDQPRFFAECRKRFGPTWTLRLPGFPPCVVTADRDAIARMLSGDPLRFRHGNDLLRAVLGDGSLMVQEPAEHLVRRRLELPAVHGDVIRAYRTRVRELVEHEVGGWAGVVGTHQRARELTLTVINELVLGSRDAALRDELAELFESFQTPQSNLAQFLPEAVRRPSRWNVPARPVFKRLDRVRALLLGEVERARRDPGLPAREDALALLMRARDEEDHALPDSVLRDELMTLVVAGHETTATAIAWACDLLAHTPAVAERLRDVDAEYVRATAKEVLRVRTVAYISAARHALDSLPVGEWVIGAEAAILVDAQGVHGDPAVHPQPEAFRPQRFLDTQPPPYSYLPFGGGAHRCLGAALATLELETFLGVLAERVDVRPAGPPAKPVRRGVTLAPGNGGRVACVPRVRGSSWTP